MLHLALGVDGVAAGDDTPEPRGGVVRDRVVRRVRHDERDAIAFPDAHAREHGRTALHLGQERRVVHVLAEPGDRRPVGEPPGRGLEHREDRFLGVRLEAVGHIRRIRREPRSVFGHARHHREVAIVAQTEEARGQGLFLRGARLVATYIRMHPRPFMASVAGSLLFALSSLALTITLGRATDEVLQPAFEGHVDASKVWLAAALLVGFASGRALGIMVRRYYSGVAGERVMATLRNRVADRYRDLQLQYHRETPTGELLAHMEADVKAAVDVFWPVPFATGVVVLTVLAMVMLFRADPWLALVGLVLFPTLALLNQSFARRMEGPAQRAQEDIGEVSAVAHESIDGALVVKTLGREAAETERLAAKAEALRVDRVTGGYLRATFEAALDTLPVLATAALLAVGSWRVASGAITVGDLVGFIALFGLLSWPMRFIGWILAELPRAVVGYDRLEAVFAERIMVNPPSEPVALPAGPLGLEVRDLRHVYDGVPILDGVSFDVQPMESVAIVGPTGVGKSTLAQLLVRLADPDAGVVRVGGVDVRDADPVALRRDVSIVFQESFLFATTVRENIALEPDVPESEVVRVGDDRVGRPLHP